jgi:hypothetical protein
MGAMEWPEDLEPVVQELVLAAREMLKLGNHVSPCVEITDSGMCMNHYSVLQARKAKLARALGNYDSFIEWQSEEDDDEGC